MNWQEALPILRRTLVNHHINLIVYHPLYDARERFFALTLSLFFRGLPRELIRMILIFAELIYPQTLDEITIVAKRNQQDRESRQSILRSIPRGILPFYYALDLYFNANVNDTTTLIHDDVNYNHSLEICKERQLTLCLQYQHGIPPIQSNDPLTTEYIARHHPHLYPKDRIDHTTKPTNLRLLAKQYPEIVRRCYEKKLPIQVANHSYNDSKIHDLLNYEYCPLLIEVLSKFVPRKDILDALIATFNDSPRPLLYRGILRLGLRDRVDYESAAVRRFLTTNVNRLSSDEIETYFLVHEDREMLRDYVRIPNDSKEWSRIKRLLWLPDSP